MNRLLGPSAGAAIVFGVALLCGCSSAGMQAQPPAPAGQLPAAARRKPPDFPGKYGVSAHYVVFEQPQAQGIAILEVVEAQAVPSYIKAFPSARRVAGAAIVYPDGSTQTADRRGRFDAAASSYAREHPEGKRGPDRRIAVAGPTGTRFRRSATRIFAPSESDEKTIKSGVTASYASTSRESGAALRPMAYTPTCHLNDYEYLTFQQVPPNTTRRLWFLADPFHSYKAHFNACGTDTNSPAWEWSSTAFYKWLGDYFEWRVDFELRDGFRNHKLALWASPNNYILARNLNVAIVGY